jgi:RNA polymerase sigma factor (sigma-70 family)
MVKELCLTELKRHDSQWIERLKGGEHDVFKEFVDTYKEMVFMCCKTVGLNDIEAQDAAMETFAAAYTGLKKFKGSSELGSWLWKIAYNKSIDILRKQNRTQELSDEYQPQDCSQSHVGREFEQMETSQIIWDSVRKLPKLWAAVVVLFYREEKSLKDIADIMKINENTVKTYLFRAKERLKEILGPVLGEDKNG